MMEVYGAMVDNRSRTLIKVIKKLYTASLREGVTENEKKSYREFRNIYNRTKRAMMTKYYSDKSSAYRTNTKNYGSL